MKNKLVALLIIGLFNTSLFAQTVTIGTSNATMYSIFNMEDSLTRHADIYTSSEIGTTGSIKSLGWNLNKIWSNGDGPVKIYLKENTASSLSSDTWANMVSGATLVYNDTVIFPTSVNNTWFTINLTTSFNYTSGNLLVLVESNYGGIGNGTVGGDIDFNCTANMTSKSEIWWGNPIQTNGSVSSNRPVIQITFDIANGLYSNRDETNDLISIFPNPTSQTFKYKLNGTDHADLIIYDMNGNAVYTASITNEVNGTIDVSMLPKGCYILSITNEKTNLHKKISIE